ncbi:LOW QUALITY PROTEIN: nuclear protein MDM1-like [Babylonia areolata]|uniref:LOW QUALITY PROTEIN: nuclear protein MDM1-like n=1 Tax=Babylonia areolata TaxID=304850 RepID=UPI003FD4F0F2
MPSKPKGRSEYKTHFKWFDSFRDKEFKPSPEQMAPAAGQDSVFSKISHEPALQHKKRIDGPPSSFSINFDDGNYKSSDDYALLGKQQKFATNVRYGLRPSRGGKAADSQAKDVNNNFKADVPPPPKQMKIAERQGRARRKLDMSETRSKKEASKENLTPPSPPPAPRKDKGGRQQQVEKEGLRDKNLADILPKAKTKAPAPAAKSKMNEGAQTDMDKGVALSHPEAPADYSLRYKAGVAPPRPVRKASEYQKEYSWKKGVPASPLLSAEQIVYNSNAQISPLKKAVVPKTTEYQAQFKTYQVPDAVSLAPKPSQEAPVQRGRTKTQMKRSKSVGAGLSPDRMAPAGSAPVTSADDPRLLRESRNSSPVPKCPVGHGKIRHKVTEYGANYKSPTRFSYQGGAWKDAFPAHLLHSKNGGEKEQDKEKAQPVEEESAQPPSWFAEVLELRRRANEYKRRAQGTHFSRQHLVQLLAQQTGYWDADSARSSRVSSLDALALEPARPAAGVPSFSQTREAVDKVSMMAMRGDSPDNEEDASSTARDSQPPAKKERKGGSRVKKAWQEAAASEVEGGAQDLNTNQNAACDAQSTEDVEEAGRLPTPVLRQRSEKLQRHHLDRTTPSVGGVLLSLPDHQVSARSGDSEETLTERSQSLKSPAQVKYSTDQLQTSPLLGKPTPDTHALRDEDAESDQVMDTRYIAGPHASLANSNKNLKALQRRMNAKIPATIDERMGETYNKDIGNFHVEDLPLGKGQEKDEDALSVSAMSIASSSTLASEVYERAKRRRDQFWGSKSDQ